MQCPWLGSPSTNIEFFWTQLSAEFKRRDYWLLLRSAFVCAILLSAGKIVHKPSRPHLSRPCSMQSAWTVLLLSCASIVLCCTCLSINAVVLHKLLSCLVLSWTCQYKAPVLSLCCYCPERHNFIWHTRQKSVCLQSMKRHAVYFSTWADWRDWTDSIFIGKYKKYFHVYGAF